MFKPMLACDSDVNKIKFPVFIQPKVDGVRGLNRQGSLLGRSLKSPKNKFTRERWSFPQFNGFDGELYSGYSQTIPDLCRITSSDVGTIEGNPITSWMVFDLLDSEIITMPYDYRFKALEYRVSELKLKHPELEKVLVLPNNILCNSLDDFLYFESKFLQEGYEGIIIRGINSMYKHGRSTIREGGLLRLKRFIDIEAKVIELVEGEKNNNIEQTNELGHTFRSSHKENKVGNGMVGSLTCKLIDNVFDPQTKEILFEKGQIITVSPGKMTHEERIYYWNNQAQLLDQIIKFKTFPKGVKDKPRFPTFVAIRSKEDL